MTSFKFRRERGPAHDRVSLFGGVDAEHRALFGVLVMRSAEADAFWRWLIDASFADTTRPPTDTDVEFNAWPE